MSEHPPVQDGKTYWLDKPSTLNLIIGGLVVGCIISFLVPTILDILAAGDVPAVDPHHGDGHGGGDDAHHGGDAHHGSDAHHGDGHGGQESHRYFNYESWYGFHALYGFCAYAFIVLSAKMLRKVLKRPEEYYD